LRRQRRLKRINLGRGALTECDTKAWIWGRRKRRRRRRRRRCGER
jgi:hypothetical protein